MKTVEEYERTLKALIEGRTGSYEPWLDAQLHTAALCWQMLEKVHEELMRAPLTDVRQGVKEQTYKTAHPLMPTYKELQRTMVIHYEALGLNFKTTPSKVTEPTQRGIAEDDPMRAFYEASMKR